MRDFDWMLQEIVLTAEVLAARMTGQVICPTGAHQSVLPCPACIAAL